MATKKDTSKAPAKTATSKLAEPTKAKAETASKNTRKPRATTAVETVAERSKSAAAKTVPAKKVPVGDVTRTARAKSLLQRLEERGGKRVVIDFDASGHAALQKLLSNSYGATQKEAVIRAVQAAAADLNDRKVSQQMSERKKKA